MQTASFKTIAILCLATLSVSACNHGDHDSTVGADQKSIVLPPVMTVPYVQIEQKPLKADLSLPGELAAYQDVPIHAKVEGYITWIGVDRGSRVKKNQSMIKVAAPELVSKVKEAEAKLAAADSAYRQAQATYESVLSKQAQLEAKMEADTLTFDRMKEAAKTPGAIAKNEVDLSGKGVEADRAAVSSIVAEIQAAKNLVDSQKNNIAAAMQMVQSLKAMETYLDIKAPFDGVVTERNVHEGSIVAVDASRLSAPLVRVQQKSVLRLIVAVPESYVSGIKKGSQISFTVPAFPGRTFIGTIARLGFALDNKTRTMPVELDVDNASGELEPGMFATVQWQVARTAPSLFVLSSAVADDLKGTYAIKIDGDRPVRVEVARGPQMGRLVEITPAPGTSLRPLDKLALKATNELEQVEKIVTRPANAEDIKKAFKQSGGGGE